MFKQSRLGYSALVVLSAVVLQMAACTKNSTTTSSQEAVQVPLTPEAVVEKFIRLSGTANSAEDKMRLRDMCQGKLRQAFDKMSNENFQMSYLSGGITVDDFKVLSQKSDGTDALVHYQVRIQNKQGADNTHELNEREVSLVQVNGVWYLDSIRPKGKDQIAFLNGMIF
jgi:hypothetical protein